MRDNYNCNPLHRLFKAIAFLIGFLVTLSLTTIAWATPVSDIELSRYLSPAMREFNYAEQQLSHGNLVTTVPVNIPGYIISRIPGLKGLEHYGSLSQEFTPVGGTLHDLIVLLIPENEAGDIVKAEMAATSRLNQVVHVEIDGKRYVRYFILPLPQNLEFFKNELAQYPRDGKKWLGLQQASGRSVTIIDPTGEFEPFTIKMDLNIFLSGSHRVIGERQVRVAPLITDLVEEAHRSSKTKTWDYMPEPIAVIGPNGKGGNIYRELPPELRHGDVALIPLFALVNSKRHEIWLDTLANAEGMTRQEFIEKRLSPQLFDTFSEMSFRFGLIPELHQQNTLVAVDLRTMRFKKIVIRDMDAVQVDLLLRESLGLESSRVSNSTMSALKGNRLGAKSLGGRLYRYEFQLRHNFKYLFVGAFLKGIRMVRILQEMDDRLVAYANALLDRPRFKSKSDLRDFTEIVATNDGAKRLNQVDPARQTTLMALFKSRLQTDRALLSNATSRKDESAWRFIQNGSVIQAIDQSGALIGVTYLESTSDDPSPHGAPSLTTPSSVDSSTTDKSATSARSCKALFAG